MMTPGERGAVRPLAVLAAVAAGLVALAGLGWAWSAYAGNAEEEELVTVVDQFEAPQTWEVLVDDLEPARMLCLGGNACPSVRKDWSVPEVLTPADMQALIDAAGWGLAVDGDCQPDENFRGTEVNGVRDLTPVCSASGTIDGVEVYLVQSGDIERSDAEMQLFARLSK
jgi:hypothetical protein